MISHNVTLVAHPENYHGVTLQATASAHTWGIDRKVDKELAISELQQAIRFLELGDYGTAAFAAGSFVLRIAASRMKKS